LIWHSVYQLDSVNGVTEISICTVTSNRGGLNPFERQKIVSTFDKVVFSKLDQNNDGNLVAVETGVALWVFDKSMTIDVAGNDRT
jgi:hypothetical protein